MDPSLDLLERFKLATEFALEEVHHISNHLDRSKGLRRVKVVKRWSRGKSLGVGSFGTVWLESEEDGSKRAVKAISRRMCSINNIDYKKELAAMANLSRFNDMFVEFFGWFENDETIYLAMEYFEHGDLQRYLSEKIPEMQIKIIMIQLLEGLKIMHQNGFTHRDLKPSNIFVVVKEPVWWVKIGDFGITKRVLNEETFLKTEIGTRDYLAPEVIGFIEEMSQYTNAVDIWSLGCICHLLLTDQLPFANMKALAPYCWGKSILPIESLDKYDVNSESIEFVKGLMAPQPAERWDADKALQSPWLKDIVYEEMNLKTLARSTSNAVQSVSSEAKDSLTVGLIPDIVSAPVHALKSSQPPLEENSLVVDKVMHDKSTPKRLEDLDNYHSHGKMRPSSPTSRARRLNEHHDSKNEENLLPDSRMANSKSETSKEADFKREVIRGEDPRKTKIKREAMKQNATGKTGVRRKIDFWDTSGDKDLEALKKALAGETDKEKQYFGMERLAWLEKRQDPLWRKHMSEADYRKMLAFEEGRWQKEERKRRWEEQKLDPEWRLHMSESDFQEMIDTEEGITHPTRKSKAASKRSKISSLRSGKAAVETPTSPPSRPHNADLTWNHLRSNGPETSPPQEVPERHSSRKGFRAQFNNFKRFFSGEPVSGSKVKNSLRI